VLVTEKGFGMVIEFINHSQVVTTITSNTVPDLHYLQITAAHALGFTDSTSCLSAMDLNTGINTVPHSKYYT
jgi:hypothetical protein